MKKLNLTSSRSILGSFFRSLLRLEPLFLMFLSQKHMNLDSICSKIVVSVSKTFEYINNMTFYLLYTDQSEGSKLIIKHQRDS